MMVRMMWSIKRQGKHRRIVLFHNREDGSGRIWVDNAPRQAFGARVAPTNHANPLIQRIMVHWTLAIFD
jgi:hypothetical protein